MVLISIVACRVGLHVVARGGDVEIVFGVLGVWYGLRKRRLWNVLQPDPRTLTLYCLCFIISTIFPHFIPFLVFTLNENLPTESVIVVALFNNFILLCRQLFAFCGS